MPGYNAGIEMRLEGNVVPGAAEITADLMRSLPDTNVFGVVRVTHAFLPPPPRSAAPVVVLTSAAAWPRWTRLSTPWQYGLRLPSLGIQRRRPR